MRKCLSKSQTQRIAADSQKVVEQVRWCGETVAILFTDGTALVLDPECFGPDGDDCRMSVIEDPFDAWCARELKLVTEEEHAARAKALAEEEQVRRNARDRAELARLKRLEAEGKL